MIEELNNILETKEVYIDTYKAGTNEWRIYDKANDIPLGNLYISSRGQYEFNLVNSFKNRNLLKEIKKDIARVISNYDDYSYE